MRFVLSVLTVLWVASATPSPLPAQVHAEPRTAPELEERFRYEPTGLSLPHPYVRGKMPVVFVHGLGARPSSWRRMIEALATDPAIDGGVQFWTFGYATGNPIPYSAYLLRRDLEEVRQRLDPNKTDPAFDRMVLVGHSMGGLLCKMIAVDSGHRLWRAVSDRPVGEMKGEGEDVKLGYGNDSRQNGPLSSRVLHNACPTGFAFSVKTRTRRLRGRGSLVPGIHHKTSIDNVFCRLAASCFVRAESEPGSGWPIDCELRTLAR
jgi:pimeloyl-ACP methyl ester carboxylesterase